ncbi:MAG: hypothetical protein IJV41_04880 [Oscillospiraceae bacterium]|nr:hypothetical protein [Oscillospiraceae bacterium]
MKKTISVLLALVLVLSLSVTAFADDDPVTYTDATTATFKVTYTATDGGTQPEETFTFSAFTCTNVENGGVLADGTVVNTSTAPVPEKIADITLNSTTTEGTATITLPTYTAVGIYTYTFNETVGTTSGVTYYKDDAVQTMKLVVTVIQDGDNKIRVAAVHVENGNTDADKTGTIANTYQNGTLKVAKVVSGNMGDKSKYFDVTVTFAPAEGESIKSAITYTGGKYTDAQTVSNNTVTIQVKDGDTITFSNVPATATYIVDEADYSSDGYTTTGEVTTATAMTSKGDVTVTITNTKTAEVDTGITLDSLPYILIVAVVLAAAVVMIINKRRNAEV